MAGSYAAKVASAIFCVALVGTWAVAAAPVKDADSSVVRQPQPPVFPEKFTVRYTFSMPHFYLTQPKGLSYPVRVWYDGDAGLRRVEAYDGTDTSVRLGTMEYTAYPRINQLDCDVFKHKSDWPESPLPDMHDWTYGGSTTIDGTEAQIWQNQLKEGDKISQYTFYVSPQGVPLQLNMIGINFLTDSHFDEYLYTFSDYQPQLPNNATGVWEVPPVCQEQLRRRQEAAAAGGDDDVGLDGDDEQARHPAAAHYDVLLPQVRSLDHGHAYTVWSHAHGRVHDDRADYDQRLGHFTRVVDMIKAHNADPSRSYTMRLHMWADWSEEEFLEARLPKKAQKKQEQQTADGSDSSSSAADRGDDDQLKSQRGGAYAPVQRFQPTLKPLELPKAVDWRGTGADPGVKDQGMCGSCYAFAATGAMEGAWFVATGQTRAFSEQQIVDCSWDYGPSGCGGGDYQPVFRYVAETGGVALEQEYPYDGENNWCRASNHTLVGHFEGYAEIASRDESALMEAVWRLGPIAVAVDAGPESFRYYSEGVYDHPGCATRVRDLDHAVLLFGYGTQDGKDYWLVRNSWAKFYGDDGYIKIARGAHDCGISTDPAVAVVAKALWTPGAQEAAMKAAAILK